MTDTWNILRMVKCRKDLDEVYIYTLTCANPGGSETARSHAAFKQKRHVLGYHPSDEGKCDID